MNDQDLREIVGLLRQIRDEIANQTEQQQATAADVLTKVEQSIEWQTEAITEALDPVATDLIAIRDQIDPIKPTYIPPLWRRLLLSQRWW